ncbi:unnamed protein product [Discula destructiva]
MTAPAADAQTSVGRFTDSIHTATPSGHVEIIHGLSSYITRGNSTSNSTIIFLGDVFGANHVNNKLLADQYAVRTGFRILIPSVLPGGGVPLALMDFFRTRKTRVAWWNLYGHTKRARARLRMTSILRPLSGTVARLYPTVLRYTRAVKASLPLGSRLGIAGICLGGHWSSRVCAEAATDGGDSALIDAHFAAHPCCLKGDELGLFASRFRVPLSLAFGDQDNTVPVDEARRAEARLKEVFRDEQDRLQVRIYENCGPEFAVRADRTKTGENEGAERALDQAVAWFQRFLA